MIFEIFGTLNLAKFLMVIGGSFFLGMFLTVSLAYLFNIEQPIARIIIASIFSVIIFLIGWFFAGGVFAPTLAVLNFFVIAISPSITSKIESDRNRDIFISGVVMIDIIAITSFICYILGLNPWEILICIILAALGCAGIILTSEENLPLFLENSILATIVNFFAVSIYFSNDILAMEITIGIILAIFLFYLLSRHSISVFSIVLIIIVSILSILFFLKKDAAFFLYTMIATLGALALASIVRDSNGERDPMGFVYAIYCCFILFLVVTGRIALSAEARIAAEMIGETMSERMKLFKQYVDFYRTLQNDPKLRARYLAGTYEIPKEQGIQGSALELKAYIKKVYVSLKDVESGTANVEVVSYGYVENPFECGVKLDNVMVNATIYITAEGKKEPYKNSVIMNCNYGNRNSIEPKSQLAFSCKGNIQINVDKDVSRENITAITYVLKPIVDYYMITASNILLRFVSEGYYTNYLIWKEELKQEPLVSVSTFGPLQGTIYVRYIGIGPEEHNPIPVPSEGLDVSLEVYAIKREKILGTVRFMKCYIVILPNLSSLGINVYNDKGVECYYISDKDIKCYHNGRSSNLSVDDIFDYCINISRDDAPLYGFPIYSKIIFDRRNDFKDKILIIYNYSGYYDPVKLNSMEILEINIEIPGNALENRNEILYPVTAFFTYYFRSYGEEKTGQVSGPW